MKRILIIEDNELCVFLYKEALPDEFGSEEVQIYWAETHDDVERIFSEESKFDLISFDGMVPLNHHSGLGALTVHLVRKAVELKKSSVLVAASSSYNNALVDAGCTHCSEKLQLVEKIGELLCAGA